MGCFSFSDDSKLSWNNSNGSNSSDTLKKNHLLSPTKTYYNNDEFNTLNLSFHCSSAKGSRPWRIEIDWSTLLTNKKLGLKIQFDS